MTLHRPRIGLALGSGSARGWAHVGVIRGLAELGVEPDVVCGTSIGALVGGAYCAGHLDTLEEWIGRMDRREVLRYLDLNLLEGGGFIEGKRLVDFFRERFGDIDIDELDKSFAAVATDLSTGREIWLRQGSLLDAMRASFALPGLFTPARLEHRWVVDGGLVNPVPVSVCRALGAEVVFAVNLNADLMGRHMMRAGARAHGRQEPGGEEEEESGLFEKLSDEIKHRANSLLGAGGPSETEVGLFDVIAGSINIMQDRITRSRMGGDPPDVVLAPRLARIGLMEFHRAAEAIEEGRAAVRRALPGFHEFLAELGLDLPVMPASGNARKET